MKRALSLIAMLLVVALTAAACSSDSSDTTTTEAMEDETTVLDLALSDGQFSTLVAAVEAAGLADTLSGEGPFTVLAPTNQAFDNAFEALGITAEELLADTETLTAILTYHVLPQEANSQLVATLDGESVETVNGQSVDISVQDGQIMVNEATVVSADLEADNGVVHVINGVLLPPDIADALGAAMDDTTTTTAPAETTTTTEAMADPTIAEIVVNSPDHTILLAAVTQAGLVDALSDPAAELTVFAPTDEAFEAALEALGITAEELLASEDLTNILLYHVVPGIFPAADVIAAAPMMDVPTLNEDATLNIEVVDGAVVINESATVTVPDVMASNGVVHVIDAVLLPGS